MMVCLDHRDPWEILDPLAHPDSQGHLALRETEEDLDQKEPWVSKVHEEIMDNLDLQVSLVAPVPLDLMDHLERKELGVIWVHLAKLDFQVLEVLQG